MLASVFRYCEPLGSVLCVDVLFFFFKQKTAYEMRISDWSSDVCSSDLYYDKIDGMIYGDNADQGYIRGRSFAHPKLRLSFSVPACFRLYNQSQGVISRDADGQAVIQLDRTPKPYRGAITDSMTKVWGGNRRRRGGEGVAVHGLPAASAELGRCR